MSLSKVRAGGGKLVPFCDASRKRAYRKQALGALNNARANPSDRGTLPVAVYRCPHCREWHLTSQPQRG